MVKRVTNTQQLIEKLNEKYPEKYEILGDYCGTRVKIPVRYLSCGHTTKTTPEILLTGRGCPICNHSPKMSESEYREYIENKHPHFSYISGYKNTHSRILIRHECGELLEYSWKSLESSKCYCPLCDEESNILRVGVNDIATTDPWMIPLLYDKEDSHRYKHQSDKKIRFVCPICKRITKKSISLITRIHKVPCKVCSSGVSYPEKFMSEILDYLDVEYIPEFSDVWTCGKRYDFYFCINNNHYLLEMDGAFHYHDNLMNGITKEQAYATDMLKDKLATEHGYTVIRINCDYGTNNPFFFIVGQIKDSLFSEIFDLSMVNFEVCNKRAMKSLTVIVSNLWNSGIHSMKEIIEMTGSNRSTIRRSLIRASESGLISDSVKQIKDLINQIAHVESGLSKRKPVMCNETGEVFNTTREAVLAHPGKIEKYFSGESDHAGILEDGTKLTWTKLYQ